MKIMTKFCGCQWGNTSSVYYIMFDFQIDSKYITGGMLKSTLRRTEKKNRLPLSFMYLLFFYYSCIIFQLFI